jgi:transcriptional regulator GlxA family with amidase domain
MKIGFLLLNEFTLMTYSAAIEPLRSANYISDSQAFDFETLSLDGSPVTASCGIAITPNGKLENISSFSHLIICGGINIEKNVPKSLVQILKSFGKKNMILGGVDTAAYALAKAGILDNKRCTIHWRNMAGLRELFPHLIVSNSLFEIDGNCMTCGGGIAPLDMMLTLVQSLHSNELASKVSEEFSVDRIRSSTDKQRIPLKSRLGTSQPKLVEAVTLMEANLEEPMSPDEIAKAVSLSRRQLERLFQKYLQIVPTRYYLGLRLNRARQLLLQTSMSIVEVAFACGFVSAPHFSKCYRDFFGLPPRDERRLKHDSEANKHKV